MTVTQMPKKLENLPMMVGLFGLMLRIQAQFTLTTS
jgi:hypothetical protein